MSEDGLQKVEKNNLTFEVLSKYRGPLMGLQILLVVFFHFTKDCHVYNVRFDGLVELFYTYIRSSGVDIFLILSGLGLYYSWSKRTERRSFYIRRFVRLLVPYFVVAIPAWIAWLVLHADFDFLGFLEDLFFLSIYPEGERWLWYVAMAAICYLIFPEIYAVVQGAPTRSEALLRTLLLCTMNTVLLLLIKLYHPEFYEGASLLISRFPAFYMGVFIGRLARERRRLSLASVVTLAVLSVVVAGPLGFADVSVMGVWSRALLNFAGCLLFAVLAWRLERTARKPLHSLCDAVLRLLSWFGRYTFEIYMIHLVLRRFFKFFELYPYRYSVEAVLVVATWVLSPLVAKLCAPIQRNLLDFFDRRPDARV